MAYGLRWPVLTGTMRVAADAGPRLARAEPVLAELLGRHPATDPAAAPSALDIARRILDWTLLTMQRSHVPLFEPGVARPVSGEDGLMLLALPCLAPRVSLEALHWVVSAVAAADIAAGGPLDAPELHRLGAGLAKLDQETRKGGVPLGLNPYWFFRAAFDLDIPVAPVAQTVYRFGTGRNGILLDSSFTSATPLIGVKIAQDKMATARVLRAAGLPAPVHAPATSEDQAVEIANRLGYPVVVKPVSLDQGLGVAAGLRTEQAVRSAYQAAVGHSRRILVERHFPGNDYRITVFQGRIVKTVLRRPGGVVGDGATPITELVQHAGADTQQLRRSWERGHRVLLTLDQEALELLAEEGLTPEAVPTAGQFVRLRRTANVSTGGTPFLYTGEIHPDNRNLVNRVALTLGLDIAGVDLIIEDIARSWLETGALVCEVNASPQIGAGSTPELYHTILRELIPGEARVRTIAIVSAEAPTGGLRELALMAHEAGLACGYSSSDTVSLGSERLRPAEPGGLRAGLALLAQPDLDLALVHLRPSEILREGLPFDACDAVLLLDPDEGGKLSAAQTAHMLAMLLPQVRRSVLLPQARQALLSAAALSRAALRRTLISDDEARDDLGLARHLAQAAGLAPGAG